jgi:hypothetical protein
MTPTGHFRHSILRVYWEGSETPRWNAPLAISSQMGGANLRSQLSASLWSRERLQQLLDHALP